jgi:hypothetical protein
MVPARPFARRFQRGLRIVPLLPALLSAMPVAVAAQVVLPTVRSTTRAMLVRDGATRFDWWVDPASQPDTYHVAFPHVGGTVTFVSDVDSLSVTVRPGETRDFLVRVADGLTCLTRVSAVPAYALARVVEGDSSAVQVLPFTMRDNRIYLTGSINGSPPLRLQLDFGASASVMNVRSRGKAAMTWGARELLVNSDGRQEMPSSRGNRLRIGSLEWTEQTITETRNMERHEDVIVGNSLFRDFVVEIDHDAQQVRLHRRSLPVPAGYSAFPLALDQGVRPLIEAELMIEGVPIRDWYLFDTGNTGTVLFSARQNRDHQLKARLGAWLGVGARRVVRVKGFRLFGDEMPSTMATMMVSADIGDGPAYGLIGNAWLRRYNVLLDNRAGVIYVKRNRQVAAVVGR